MGDIFFNSASRVHKITYFANFDLIKDYNYQNYKNCDLKKITVYMINPDQTFFNNPVVLKTTSNLTSLFQVVSLNSSDFIYSISYMFTNFREDMGIQSCNLII
jgi:hypothetical protein